MDRQPYSTPPRHWAPQMSPVWVRLCRPMRRRVLKKQQRMVQIDVDGNERLRELLDDNAGILITPNHSFHYDSFVLWEAAHKVGRPFHFMAAWQVFALSSRLERWWLQKHGCFSINREANDMQAFRQAVRILQESMYPLVIFPEGEIYHINDRTTPFREGAAAIALSAARKSKRPIYCVPTALKCWYLEDPTPELHALLDQLEDRLTWRPSRALSLTQRVYRVAEGLVSLKEIEYLGYTRSGTVQDRCGFLVNEILAQQQDRYQMGNSDLPIPERVKELRRLLIELVEDPKADDEKKATARTDMEDLHLVVQLFSYPGDYMSETMSIERIAETLDKLEEDLLQRPVPTARGTRRVAVRFGEPIPLPTEKQKRTAVVEWTHYLQGEVQGLLDSMNAEHNGARSLVKVES
ncbi:MAG: lysophospholipid acyltransferase family protein [Gemmataceae bacterium]